LLTMEVMKIDGNSIDFFISIPDEILAKIAFYDWEALERLCIALTIDIQLMKELNKKQDTSYIV
jgi:hypothetical protein